MKSTPMLMSGPLVVPTLAGLKTHTCRPIKMPRSYEHDEVYSAFVDGAVATLSCDPGPHQQVRCPFGTVGDQIWIRETWAARGNDDGVPVNASGDVVPWGPGVACVYRAGTHKGPYGADILPDDGHWFNKWRPSVHMPRWASRITLEITDVSVFRVQAITEEIAKREGVDHALPNRKIDGSPSAPLSAVSRFKVLWTMIYGAESWATNPWVWGIGFKRVKS